MIDHSMLWLVQADGHDDYEGLTVYVQQSLDSLIKNIETTDLSLLIYPLFVSWRDINQTYAALRQGLDRIAQFGLCMFYDSSNANSNQPTLFPSADCLNRLTDMFFRHEKNKFHALLASELAPVRTIDDLHAALPNPIVSMITLLVHTILKGIAQPEWTLQRFSDLLQCLNHPDGNHWADEIIALMDNLFLLTDHSLANETNDLIDCIDAYLQLNYQKDISLSSIAEYVHYNTSYLSRIYKERKGTNLNNIRMEHACKMLKDTDLSIQEISRQTGFFSPNYFSKVFRKCFGISPADYRSGDAKK